MLASEAREKHQKAVCARTRLTITVDQVRSTHEPVPCGEPAPFVWVAASQQAKAIISGFSPAIRLMMSVERTRRRKTAVLRLYAWLQASLPYRWRRE